MSLLEPAECHRLEVISHFPVVAEVRLLGNRIMLVGANQGVSAFRLSLYVAIGALSLFFLSSSSAQ
ncbi:MAG TPA: hypothetical protein DEO65_06955 [Bacillus bacterium]|nr:hypothetical protein [Bacillus sp. (in: firmicutes)]